MEPDQGAWKTIFLLKKIRSGSILIGGRVMHNMLFMMVHLIITSVPAREARRIPEAKSLFLGVPSVSILSRDPSFWKGKRLALEKNDG